MKSRFYDIVCQKQMQHKIEINHEIETHYLIVLILVIKLFNGSSKINIHNIKISLYLFISIADEFLFLRQTSQHPSESSRHHSCQG